MACDATKGMATLQCKNAISGLKAIYIANYADYNFVTSSTDTTGHILTDLGDLEEVFKYELKNSANTFQEDINSSRDNGTTFYNQVLSFTLTKINRQMHFQVKMLAWGRPIIFVETNSGDFFVMGILLGTEVAGNSQVQGTMDSLNGYQLTATGMEKNPAYFLVDTAVTALKALVSTSNIVVD